MASNTKSAFADKKMLGRAIKDSFIKLNPKTQVQNPVMLLVYISAILTSGLWIVSLFGLKDASSGYTLAIAVILWFTCIFANFAEAIAEGRGKAQADALRMAASNENGAMMGFMGMGMVQQAGGANLNGLYEMNNQQMSAAQNQAANQTAAQSEMPANTANASEWTCECGTVNTAKFCQNCGTKKPEVKEWTCECGTVNTGNFCQNCGTKKPVSLEWTCGCGTVNKGNFCSNCGGKKPE